MKIVHITTVPETLGFLAGHIAHLKASGFLPTVVSSPGEALQRFARSEEVPSFAVPMSRRITPFRDFLALLEMWGLLRTLRPQIVHAHTPKGGLLGVLAAFLAGVPIRIYHIHGLPYVTASGYRRVLLRLSERVSCFLAHRVLCVADSNAELAVAEGLCDARKIRVLLKGSINGVDAEGRFNPFNSKAAEAAPIPDSCGIPPEALVIGFVGRVVRDKGIRELHEAWRALREDFPELHLVLVGLLEPQDPLPSETIESLRNDHRVHWMGWVEDVAPIYSRMDVLTLPSYREGWGVVLLEAAAMRVPTVATRIPGCVDAVVDGVTGTLVPPRDASALAEAIRTYLRDAELRLKHGQAARERALRDFRPEALWNALYQEYLALLEGKRLPAPTTMSASTRDGRQA